MATSAIPISTVGSSAVQFQMTPRLIISSLVIERLKAIERDAFGQLVGIRENDTLLILGFYVKEASQSFVNDTEVSPDSFTSSYKYDMIPHFPANFNAVAGFIVTSKSYHNEWEEKFFKTGQKLTPMLLTVDNIKNEINMKLKKNEKYEKVDFQIQKEALLDKFVHFRVIGNIELACDFDSESLEDALKSIKNRINQGVCIQLKGSNIYLLENGADGPGVNDDTTVEDLRSLADPKMHFEDKRILMCGLLLKNDSSKLEASPIITHVRGSSVKFAITCFPIDALSIVSAKTKISKLHATILESLWRNVTLIESVLRKDFFEEEWVKSNPIKEVVVPRIYHFFPKSFGHFITIAYPKSGVERLNYVEALSKMPFREILQRMLVVPKNQPLFRPGNDYVFETESRKPGLILTNPHEGLSPSGVKEGSVFLVQGRYDYHHYMQDGVDDNGWGCAYRSLQTIISWYRHQGFSQKPIPTHKQIQEALVAHGDKPKSFVGSTQWIGSVEVSFVLEKLLNVSSRIVQVNKGIDMAYQGGLLSHHFKKEGTPVMIGGGCLAHTIIGVDYNNKTGDIKFLVLDPHYPGEEDLAVIQGKGWCGWKGMNFWKKDNFYNMCLPLKPSESDY